MGRRVVRGEVILSCRRASGTIRSYLPLAPVLRADMETSRAVLPLTLPIIVIMVLILVNWNDGSVTMHLALAYGTGVVAGVAAAVSRSVG